MASTLGRAGTDVVHSSVEPISTRGLTDSDPRRSYIRSVLARLNRWDVLVPAGVAVIGVLELAALRYDGWGWGVLLELVACTLLVGRRLHPMVFAITPSLLLLLMPYLGPQLDEPATPILVMAVGVYALGRWLADLRGLVGVAAFLVLMLADYTFADARDHDVSDVVFVLSLVAPPYILGRIARRLADQKELLEERQELIRREAVRNERDRIAREHARRHRPLRQRHGRPDGGRAGPRAPRTPTAPNACSPMSPTPAVARSPRRAGCCTCCVTTPTSSASSRRRGSPTWPAWSAAFRASGLTVDLEVPDDAAAAARGRRRVGVPDRAGGADQRAEVRHATRRRGCAWPRPRTLCRSRPPTRAAAGAGPARASAWWGSPSGWRSSAGTLSHGVRDGRFELTASLPVAP